MSAEKDSTEMSDTSQDKEQDDQKEKQAIPQQRYPPSVKPMAGHSAFLQKRLAKGQKYFDSGDYQMAKQMGKSTLLQNPRMMPPILSVSSTTEGDQVRKTSLAQPPSKLANS